MTTGSGFLSERSDALRTKLNFAPPIRVFSARRRDRMRRPVRPTAHPDESRHQLRGLSIICPIHMALSHHHLDAGSRRRSRACPVGWPFVRSGGNLLAPRRTAQLPAQPSQGGPRAVHNFARYHQTARRGFRARWLSSLAIRRSYLERETGIEPATLCLEGRCPAFLAAPDSSRQFPLRNRPFRASDSGRAEHLIEACLEPCRSVKPSD